MMKYLIVLALGLSAPAMASNAAQGTLDANPFQATHIAYSKTAMAVTGDIRITPAGLEFQNGESLPLESLNHNDSSQLFSVPKAENPKLINGNYLCDEESPVTFVLMRKSVMSGTNILEVAIYTNEKASQLIQPGKPHQVGFCAAYSYINDSGK